jgi:hypothetical protein
LQVSTNLQICIGEFGEMGLEVFQEIVVDFIKVNSKFFPARTVLFYVIQQMNGFFDIVIFIGVFVEFL